MDFERFKTKLYEFDALRDGDEIKFRSVPHIQPVSSNGWPRELHPVVRDVLINSGISAPYQHQRKAISRSLLGYDVVIESPTASGKTIAFTAPMLDVLIRAADAHALMIYPMKALAFDQRTQIRSLCEPLGIESWPYDRDTDEEHRNVIRSNPPQILLTNPEYLNSSFLSHADKWHHFLSKLRYVIVDEMHEYRGFFGSNMALLLRRFFLHLSKIGSNPRVFLSTATCANPVEHARNLTGREVEVISAKDTLRPRRDFFFVNPDIPEHIYRQIFQLRIENAALAILKQGLQALVFCPTKRFLEDAFRNCQRKAEENGLNPAQLSPFHADLNNNKRQEIQQQIKSGNVRIIFTTNALELGLDIGGLDGVVLAGFPSNIMSAWQQIGRAGRAWNKEAFVLFYAMNDPIDRFFVRNIEAFLNKPFDQLVVDPNNEELISNHLPSLIAETGGEFHAGDRTILGNTFYDIARNDGGRPVKNWRPQFYLNLRGSFGNSYKLKHGNAELGKISDLRRFREAYIGAIFTFFGRKYRVHSHEADAVQLNDTDQSLRTEAGFYHTLYQDKLFDGYGYGALEVFHGTVTLQMNFTGYKLVDEPSGEVKDSVHSSESRHENNLYAVWLNIPTDPNKSGDENMKGIGALENLFRVGAIFVIPAERFDTSTGSSKRDGLTIYYYENYKGGIGVAKKFFEVWPQALQKGIEVAQNCPCRNGCQNCIEPAKSWTSSNAEIDKQAGISIANKLLYAERKGPDYKFHNGRMISI